MKTPHKNFFKKNLIKTIVKGKENRGVGGKILCISVEGRGGKLLSLPTPGKVTNREVIGKKKKRKK